MSTAIIKTVVALPAVASLLIAGCGSVAAGKPERVPPAATLPQLATSVTTAAGTSWAIVVMGGSSGQHNNFWQLFTRPAGTLKWRQVTPPGVADNGGLVAGVTGPSALVTGFRPSRDLAFSPLAVTADGGASWSISNPVSSGLADVADALAADPAGQLLALTGGGTAELSSHQGAAWTKLTSAQSLARTPAGRACGLTMLTAAAFGAAGATPAGTGGPAGTSGGNAGANGTAQPAGPMLAGRCDRPGVAGIFALRGGRWQAAGPAVPATLTGGTRRAIEVLRMVTLGSRTVALLEAGTGPAATVLAAWSGDGGEHWRLSAPLRAGTSAVQSASFGPGGAAGLVLAGGRGAALAGPGASWQALPALPRWTTVLTVGPAGHLDALSTHGSSFADWKLPASPAGATVSGDWSEAQRLSVTIPYGSSG